MRRLIFFDQRGAGRSDKAHPGEYTVDANVEDVEGLRRELALDDSILFGHSWGGMLAQAYVLKYPAASDMPTIAMAQATAGSIPGARLVVLEHSRHFPFIEEPEKFLTVMRGFMHGEL